MKKRYVLSYSEEYNESLKKIVLSYNEENKKRWVQSPPETPDLAIFLVT